MNGSLLQGNAGLRLSWFLLALTIALASLPRQASAQSVADPRIVQFTPSPDHNKVWSDGTPLVQKYVFAVYQAGAAQPFETLDIGKPAPAADNQIYYDFSGALAGWVLPGGTYESRVYAVGPGGSTTSAASNTFTFTQSCSYGLSPLSSSFPSSGGGGSISVATGAGCPWTATSNVSWVTMNTTGGSGSGTAIFTVTANTSSSNRSGTLTIGGVTYTVSQQGAGCGFSLSLYTQSVPASGGINSVAVTSSGGCSWTATSNASWLTLTSGTSGIGNGTVTYTADANPLTTSRTGTLTIAGLTLTVNQPGTVVAGTLPAPWQHQDIGTVAVSGTASYSSGLFTVSGGGSGIAGTIDAFHFVYQPVAGDVQIVARVASLSATPNTTDAGLVLRETSSPGARNVAIVVRTVGQVDVFQRSRNGGQTVHVTSTQTAAKWLRLVRSGKTVTVAMSADGATWTIVATVNARFTGTACLGLAVTSANATALSTGTFDNVAVR